MKVLILAKKELLEIFRETSGFLYLFLMPAALLIVFNLTLAGAYNPGGSGDKPLRMTVANTDAGEMGAKLVEQLNAMEWIRTETENSKGIVITEEMARNAVSSGVRSAAVIIPESFSADVAAGNKPTVRILVDPAIPVQFIGPLEGALSGALFASQFGFDMSLLSQQNAVASIEREVVVKDDADGEKASYPTIYQQNLSGYSIMSIFFLIMSIGSAMITEKDNGTFTRILAAPMRKSTYLAGKLLPYLLIALMQVGLLVILSKLLYGTDVGNHYLSIILITLCTAAASCGLGLAMVTIFRARGQFEGISIVVVLILTAFSGSFVPRFVLPEAVQQAGLFIPQTWALIAYQDVMVRNMGLVDILPHCGVILGFAVLFFTFGVLRFRFE